MTAPHTGWLVADEFAARFVFFYTGYWASPLVFRYAAAVSNWPVAVITGALLAWAVINALLVDSGYAFVTGPDLWISCAGVAAVVAASVLLVSSQLGTALAHFGRNSIRIYLAFPLLMGPARIATLNLMPFIPD